jgi:cation diffusion facilitator CzcD-associated flavoprotein CzcO
VLAYLRDYARHFGVYEHIQFNTAVERCERDEKGMWQVTLDSGETRRYAGLIIANGHVWQPNLPDFPGSFEGDILHTKHYKTPDILRGKRVLIVGAGNTGCDVAVEAVHHAEKVYHSARRGYYYIPKYILGIPTDQFNHMAHRLWLPHRLRRVLQRLVIWLAVGSPTNYGLPAPDHGLLESHPIANSQLPYHVGHGDILPKPDVRELRRESVVFADGSEAKLDLIIYATGYTMSFPFIDQRHLHWQGDGPGLYMHFLHPEYDNLFVIGLLESDSGIFWLMDYQAQVIARFIKAQRQNPTLADELRRIKAGPEPAIRGGIHHIDSPRHFLEINHITYRQHLKKLLKLLKPAQ